ncbi:FecCD family ABC transporter permease [Novisyntrophococcus fermenticellae]|uniref:FecCD family ABC transporter permease n=1 Tax=Novisyntrophococcus fermenticellae TaxID=2068655 RepID=UPI001E5073EA|nr:iron ABC transporter permease [Novisyntrophococcus fermenticellae]
MQSLITQMWSRKQDRTRRGKKKAYVCFIICLAFILLLSLLFSISIGVAGGNLKILLHTLTSVDRSSEMGRIMLEMRMPRALAACFTGAAFALSGAVMQGTARNPLADAGLLGINAGAGFLVALSAVAFPSISSMGTMLLAFIGAAGAAIMVYGIGMGNHKVSSIRLILAGSAVSALLTALSQGISLTFGLSKKLSFWTAGSLSGITWNQLVIVIPWIMGAGITSLFLGERMSMLALGEASAAGLGINVISVKLLGIGTVLIMAGASVSLVGGISFLGLIVPHSARRIVGADYRRVLPASALMGAILLVLADVAARMIYAPFDTPVGALVSAIGVPVFLGLTWQRKGAVL